MKESGSSLRKTRDITPKMQDHPYYLDILIFASPVYWQNQVELETTYAEVCEIILKDIPQTGAPSIRFELVDSDTDVEKFNPSGTLALFIPLSGGIQKWMKELSGKYEQIALLNAYLPDPDIPERIGHRLLAANAHPAATDFYANLRMNGRPVYWLSSIRKWSKLWKASQAVQTLRSARLLMIGETEPWVLNSCRNSERFGEALGVQIIHSDLEELYEELKGIQAETVRETAESWINDAVELKGINSQDVMAACRLQEGIRRLVEKHDADGVAVGCFRMIRDLDTTSCLALSYINSSTSQIAACEGDLDAAVTMLLLRALGADFLWIANPVIHETNQVDLVHCTAPCSDGKESFDYDLLRHHESGRGVSPAVALPGNRDVTLVRIGNNLTELLVCQGQTLYNPKLPSCRTQMKVEIESSRQLVDNLTGTHLVCAFGDWGEELESCAQILGFKYRSV